MIVAGMATMPERVPYLEKVVEAIRPQVDAIRIYLNGFEEVPAFLNKEEGILSSDAMGDLGDLGKFYWLNISEGDEYSHYLTIDDDLGYPEDYVETLVEEFDARSKKAIVGVHASTFTQPIENFVTSRDERFRFYEGLAEARSVHILGTATAILCRSTINMSFKDFPLRNASDLQLAILAQKQRVPMVTIPRNEGWVTEMRPWDNEGFSVWKETKALVANGRDLPQTVLAQTAIASWELFEDPATN